MTNDDIEKVLIDLAGSPLPKAVIQWRRAAATEARARNAYMVAHARGLLASTGKNESQREADALVASADAQLAAALAEIDAKALRDIVVSLGGQPGEIHS